jgi:hypothetical protein
MSRWSVQGAKERRDNEQVEKHLEEIKAAAEGREHDVPDHRGRSCLRNGAGDLRRHEEVYGTYRETPVI